MTPTSHDKVIQEKMDGLKASWELPEEAESSPAADAGASVPSDDDDDTGVPTNYENTERSYSDPGFEVLKAPGRLG